MSDPLQTIDEVLARWDDEAAEMERLWRERDERRRQHLTCRLQQALIDLGLGSLAPNSRWCDRQTLVVAGKERHLTGFLEHLDTAATTCRLLGRR